MVRRSRLQRRRDRPLLRSLLRKSRRWLVGMAERCCRARRCGLVSLVVERRVVSHRLARAAVVIVIAGIVAESAEDVGGIAGVVAMKVEVVEASATMRLAPTLLRLRRRLRSSVRSRAGLIRQRP